MDNGRLQDGVGSSNRDIPNKEGVGRGNGHNNFRNKLTGRFAPTDPVTSFLSKLDRSGDCWLWTGKLTRWPIGYAPFRGTYAHRFSYELYYGPIPSGLQVLHKCDVRHCVRPDHLFLGTMVDNMRDRHRKGRDAKGENAGNSKLTASDVVAIRRNYVPRVVSQRLLAARYGVSQRAIGNVLAHRTYTEI